MDRSAGNAARARAPRCNGLPAGGLALALLLASCGAAVAGEALVVPLPAPFPPVRVLTLLVGLHLLGLCFGLGGATMLDFWILRWMRWGSLPAEIARIFLFVSKVVSVGLALLWFSGLGFLAVYAVESPEKFDNPKLWAKVAVVLALTVNGLVIHALVLPGVLRDIGRPMLEGVSGLRTGVFLVSGAVSGVSWYTAFALGLMRELNGRVPAGLILALWLAGVMAASLGAYFYWLHLREWTLRKAAGMAQARETAAPPPAAMPRPAAATAPAAAQEIRVPAAPARVPADRILALPPVPPVRAGACPALRA